MKLSVVACFLARTLLLCNWSVPFVFQVEREPKLKVKVKFILKMSCDVKPWNKLLMLPMPFGLS